MAAIQARGWGLAARLRLAGNFVIGSLLLIFPVKLAPQTLDMEGQDGSDIPRTYRSFSLGMSPNEVKGNLEQDNWFNYRGDPDVSLLQRPRASVIDTEGFLFISRALFQFEEDSLIVIILELNPQRLDWYTVYSTLEDKYGTPSDMGPSRIIWEDAYTRLTMEKPLTVKYLDRAAFNAASDEDFNRKAWLAQARSEFLNEF